MNSLKQKKVIGIAVCMVLILISMIPMTKKVSDPKTYSSTIGALDEKTTNVMELTAVTTATSVAITAMPGDTGTTVAEHLMDLNSSLLFVLTALFLEKYLLTIIGKAVFFAIIPIGLLMIVIGIGKEDKHFILKSINIILTGILLFAAIPAGVGLSEGVESVYNFSLDSVVQSGKEAKASTEGVTDDTSDTADDNTEDAKKGNVLTDTWSKVTDTVSGAVTGVMDTVTGALEQGKEFLKTLTEALAILIVTSCVIPLLTVIFFLWLIKMCIGLDFGDKLLSLHHTISVGQKKTLKKIKTKDAIVEK